MRDGLHRLEEIQSEEARKIINTRKPLGKFFKREGDFFVGIDNSTGDAWTEEFDQLKDCIEWLNGEKSSKMWPGLKEISKEQAVSLFKKGEEVFGVDHEGYEAVIENKDDFNTFDVFAIERII